MFAKVSGDFLYDPSYNFRVPTKCTGEMMLPLNTPKGHTKSAARSYQLFLLALVWLIVGASATAAQSSATLTETLDWIKEMVNDHAETSVTADHTSLTTGSFQFDGCTIQWTQTQLRFYGGKRIVAVSVKTVALGDLDPDRVESQPGRGRNDSEISQLVIVNAFDGKKAIKDNRQITVDNEPLTQDHSEASDGYFILKNEVLQYRDNGMRVRDALAHAIKLCGGKAKKEPF